MAHTPRCMRDRLRLTPGAPVDLAAIDPGSTPGAPGDRDETHAAFQAQVPEFEALQERLMGEGRRSLLVLLQGMDTSGKGGVIKYLDAAFYPLGLQIASFGKPTEEELRHDFLWRVRPRVPGRGHIGIFDRSHYEDVLIARVHDLVPRAEWEGRYEQIVRFEEEIAAGGVLLVKCMLHISRERQKERLLARLDDPSKHWKFDPSDIDERAFWDDYQEAYRVALERTGTAAAPWHVVPADRKWYRKWAVSQLVLEALRELDPQLPVMSPEEVAAQKARLRAQG